MNALNRILLLSAIVPGALAALCSSAANAQVLQALATERSVLIGESGGTARFPVTLEDGVNPATVRLQLLDTSLGTRSDDDIASAITLDPTLLQNGGRLPQLRFEVKPNAGTPPGTYDLVVEASAGELRNRLELQLVIPAATVQADPARLVVEHIIPMPPFGQGGTTLDLELREVSGATAVTGMTVSPVGLIDAAGLGTRATVEWESPPSHIDARGAVTVSGEIEGEANPGTLTGRLFVRSPLLANPLDVPIEVRVRRTRAWIPIVIVLGVLIGLLSRVVLLKRKELAEAALAAGSVATEMRRAIEDNPDSEFRRAVGDAVKTLQDAISDEKSPASLAAAAATATTKFDEARTKLQNDTMGARSRIGILDQIVSARRSLPATIADLIDALRPRVEHAADVLDERRVTESLRTVDEIEDELIHLRTPIADWQDAMSDGLDDLGPDFRAVEPMGAFIRDAATTLHQDIAALVVPADPELKPDEVLTLLKGIHAARVRLEDLRRKLRRRFQRLLDEADRRIASLQDAKPLSDAVRTTRAWLATLEVVSLESAFGRIAGDVSEVDAEWHAALTNLGSRVAKENQEAFGAALDEHRYLDAIPLVGPPAGVETVLGDEEPEERAIDETPWQATVGTRAESAPDRRFREVRIDPLSATLADKRRDLTMVKGMQTLIAGLLIVVVGWNLFAPSFVGTFAQMTGVFFWGFALDISVDTALQQAAGLNR